MLTTLVILILTYLSNPYSLILFTSDNCHYCHLMRNDLNKEPYSSLIKENFGKYNIINLSRAENREIGQHYNIKSVPTLVIFDRSLPREGNWPTIKKKIVGYDASAKAKQQLNSFLSEGTK